MSRPSQYDRDSRYPPRDRSPPRFTRPPYGRPLSPSGRDAPRGPRDPGRDGANTFSDSRRASYAGRADFRDAPPLSDAARRFGRDGRDTRDSDYDLDRRERRPPSPRGRSPPRFRRDSRERGFPTDLDIPRARRSSRDGPPSAGSNLSDASRPFSAQPTRGGLGRGSGRGDLGLRGRGRPPFADDRGEFRPRSRSRGSRVERDHSRDSRDFDRRDRREDERRLQRDDRDDRFRRDGPPRAEPRQHGGASDGKAFGDIPSAANSRPPPGPVHPDRAAIMDGRDEPTRRASVALDSLAAREARRDLEKGEIPTSRERAPQRAPSPPQSGPQVAPAVPSFSLLNFSRPVGPTSNVWRAPTASTRPGIPLSSLSLPSVPTLGANNIPTGPKAESTATGVEAGATLKPERPSGSQVADTEQVKTERPSPAVDSTSVIPTAPRAATPKDETKAVSIAGSPLLSSRDPPTGPRAHAQAQAPPAAPAAPAALLRSPQPQPNAPRADSAAHSTPSRPRMAPLATSPTIPTGPRADRGLPPGSRPSPYSTAERAPPSGPRLGPGAPPRANQWLRPGAPYSRPGVVPAKRSAEVDEKDESRNMRRSPALERSSSYNDFGVRAQGVPTARSEPDDDHGARAAFLSANRTEPELQDDRAWPEKPRTSAMELSPGQKPQMSEDVTMAEADTRGPSEGQNELDGQLAQLDDSSDDENFEFGAEYIAEINAKFERETALLRGRKADLSQPQFRATSPLRRIAFLDALTEADLPFKVSSDQSVGAASPDRALRTGSRSLRGGDRNEGGMVPLKTEHNGDTNMADASTVVRVFKRPVRLEDLPRTPSPDASSLPFLVMAPPTPGSDPEQMVSAVQWDCKTEIDAELLQKFQREEHHRDELRVEFADLYGAWKRNALRLDREAREEEERKELELKRLAEQGKTPEPAAETAVPVPLSTPADGGGRRSHRFASQLDFDLAIQASLETHKEDQAKQEREAVQVQADPEKEATIPPLLNSREIDVRLYYDTNQARRPERAIEVFDFVPAVDDFTEEEHEILVQGYKADPKAWGKIAQSLPGRTFKDCINHYYSTKWTTDYKSLKDRRKRRQRTRAARGSARPNALMSLDVKDDDGNAPSVTETGRPRRQAAPTFGDKTIDDDTSGLLSTGKKPGMNAGEGTVEKGKRQKVVKEKTARRTKNQALVARPHLSPTKQDKELKARSPAMESKTAALESLEKWPNFGEGALAGDRINGFGMIGRPVDGLHPQPPTVPTSSVTSAAERPRAQSGQQPRSGPSSYWSVQEQTDFKKYVMYYGTDFQQISALMGTKTHIMVKNFFERKKAEGSMQDVIGAAFEADEKRKRGDALGPPPTPAAARRTLPSTQPNVPRNLAPNTDAMQLDGSPPGPSRVTLQQSPQQRPASSRLEATSPLMSSRHTGSQQPQQPYGTRQEPASKQAGPRHGFFEESRSRAPSLLQQQYPPDSATQAATFGQAQLHQDERLLPKREDALRRDPGAVSEEERRQQYFGDYPPARPKQESDFARRPAGENVPFGVFIGDDRMYISKDGPIPSKHPAPSIALRGGSGFSMSSHSSASYHAHLQHTSTPPSFDSKPAQPPLQQQQQVSQTAKPDPPKRTNLMDLLNPVGPSAVDKEREDRQARERERSVQAAATPRWQYLQQDDTRRPDGSTSRVPSGDAGPHRSFSGPTSHHGQQQQHQPPPHSARSAEDARYRQSEHHEGWQTQHRQVSQPDIGPARVNSPLGHRQSIHVPAEYPGSRSDHGSHRALLGGHGIQSRVIPSPPPSQMHIPPHTRPGSIAQVTAPHLSGQPPSLLGGGRIHTPPQESVLASRGLHANPYARVPPPLTAAPTFPERRYDDMQRSYGGAASQTPAEGHVLQHQYRQTAPPDGHGGLERVNNSEQERLEHERRMRYEADRERDLREREALHRESQLRHHPLPPGQPASAPPPAQHQGHNLGDYRREHERATFQQHQQQQSAPPPSDLRSAHNFTPVARSNYQPPPPPPSLTPVDRMPPRDDPRGPPPPGSYYEQGTRPEERRYVEEPPREAPRSWTIDSAQARREQEQREQQERERERERERDMQWRRDRDRDYSSRGFGGRG